MRRNEVHSPADFGPPSLPDWAKNLLVGLFILYALELASRNVLRLPVDRLVWWPGGDFAWWQPLTRYLVQGNEVIWVFLAGVVLAMLFPVLDSMPRKQAWQLVGAAAAGGTVLAGAVQLVGIAQGPGLGWSSMVTALLVAFGLRQPNATIRLFMLFPIPAWAFVWGTGAISFLSLLAYPGIQTADHLGTFIGVLVWWNYLGPGARERALRQKSASIERQLRNLTVIDGGKNRPKDDVFH